jgi:hypothetical protein
MTWSIMHCRFRKCENLTRRPVGNQEECSLTHKLPGNMTSCPVQASLDKARASQEVHDEVTKIMEDALS